MFHARRVTRMLAIASLAVGCATQRPTARISGETGPSSPSTIVTAQQLARLVRQGSLMDAIEQLRPSWLGRGSPPLVSVDGSTPADLSSLRLIPVSTVQEVRLQRASSSVGRSTITPNGYVRVGDVIVVSTRKGD